MLAATSVLERSWWRSRPDALARLLQPLSWVYRLLVWIHRGVGRRQAAVSVRPAGSPPVVVVGNWIVGGAGKTPTTLAVLAHLRSRGWTPGVISRGHGARADHPRLVDPQRATASDVGDEPLLIARRAQVPVCVGRDRCRARDLLLRDHPEVDIVVADDGLQHHRLHRDLEVIVVDERGAGNGLCLPAGPLRQPLPTAVPLSALVLYPGGKASLPHVGHLANRVLEGVVSLQEWQSGSQPASDGGWHALQGRLVHAVAGVAAPGRFFEQLRRLGMEVHGSALPDHDPMHTCPWPQDARDVVMTEKDAVKAARWDDGQTRLWVARLDLVPHDSFWHEFDRRLEALDSRLHNTSTPHGSTPS